MHTPMPSPEPASPPDDSLLRDLVLHAVCSGLAGLIPLPFVDEWAERFVRRRMVRRLPHAPPLPRARLNHLANGPSPWLRGCLMFPVNVVRRLILWPLKRFLRKLLIVLAVKDCVDAAAETFHVGCLLNHAWSRGIPATTDAEAQLLRRVVMATIETVDARPFNQLLRHAFAQSRGRLRQARRSVAAMLRRWRRQAEPHAAPAAEPEPEPISLLVSAITEGLRHESGYLLRLTRAFDQQWEAAHTSVGGPST